MVSCGRKGRLRRHSEGYDRCISAKAFHRAVAYGDDWGDAGRGHDACSLRVDPRSKGFSDVGNQTTVYCRATPSPRRPTFLRASHLSNGLSPHPKIRRPTKRVVAEAASCPPGAVSHRSSNWGLGVRATSKYANKTNNLQQIWRSQDRPKNSLGYATG
jgi:hypothetical protein